jgi:amino acid permease
MFFFSFGNHNAILNVVKDLNNPTKKRAQKVVRYSFYIEFYVYLSTMLIGYFSTFENTNEIFIDRHDQSFFLLFGKMFYVIALTCHIGMYYYISKPSLQHYFNNGDDFNPKQYLLILN